MDIKLFLIQIKRKRQVILAVVFLFLAIAVILTVIQPFKYLSSSRLLVIQNFSPNTDPYTVSKSNEYLSNILAEVVHSSSFFNNVLETNFNIDKNYFGKTAKDQEKNWLSTISAKTINDTGIISISVYHKDKYQADQINRAVDYVLQTKHGLYHGGADNVSIKIIDEPLTGDFPAKPNIILNFSLAIVLALIFLALYIYRFPEENQDLISWLNQEKNEPAEAKYSPRVSTEYSSKNNWQAIERIIKQQANKAPAQAGRFANEPDDLDRITDNSNNQNLSREKYINQYKNEEATRDLYEEIVKNGDMKNIFGRPVNNDL